MSSWNQPRCTIVRGEVVQKPEGRDNAVRLGRHSRQPVRMKPLLPITRQRVTPAQLGYPERAAQDVIDGSKNFGMGIDTFEIYSIIDQIFQLSSAALLTAGSLPFLCSYPLECRPQLLEPGRADGFRQDKVALLIK